MKTFSNSIETRINNRNSFRQLYQIIAIILLSLSLAKSAYSQTSDSIRAVQKDRARATGHAVVAAKNPGSNFSIQVIPWDETGTLEENAQNQINSSWHAQAAVKGNNLSHTFDGSDFMYSSVVHSESSFDSRKHLGSEWWIICSTLPPFSGDVNQTLWESDGINSIVQRSDNDNLFLGNNAGSFNSGIYNVGIGLNALKENQGNNNIGIGTFAGERITNGYSNVSIGNNAGRFTTSGSNNVAIGPFAGYVNNGSGGIFIGNEAGKVNNANYNIFLGHYAGRSNTSGHSNFFMGYYAGNENLTGIGNLFIGRQAGQKSKGSYNTFMGYLSGANNITGGFNFALGYYTLFHNTSGSNNYAIGYHSMLNNISGNSNLSIGTFSLYSNTAGSQNTALGRQAGYSSLGSRNLFIGYQAGYNEIGSDRLYIENSNSESPLIYGEFDNDFLKVNGELEVSEKLAIGTAPIDGYDLAVLGKIKTTEVQVQPSPWPDYVFDPSYQLTPLSEVEKQIKKEGHLEGIPSQSEVEQNGIAVGEMNAKLLEKIEELTLYLIEQDKALIKQGEEIEQLKNEIINIKADNK